MLSCLGLLLFSSALLAIEDADNVYIDWIEVNENEVITVQTIPPASNWKGACFKSFGFRVDESYTSQNKSKILSLLTTAKVAKMKVNLRLNNDSGCYVPVIKRVRLK